MNYQFIWGWGKLSLNHHLKIQALLMLFVKCDFSYYLFSMRFRLWVVILCILGFRVVFVIGSMTVVPGH
jgi:hypothetical protein